MLNIFSRPLLLEYRSRLLTWSTLVISSLTIIHYVLPLYLVWTSDGFWIKESHFREMPNVEFTRQLVTLLEIDDNRTSTSRIYGFSTFATINAALEREANLLPVQIHDSEEDDDLDHRLDRLNVELIFPIDLRFDRIRSIEVILFVRYRLSERIELEMQSLARTRLAMEHQSPAQGVHILGDLNFVQHKPFYHRGHDYTYNQTIMDDQRPVIIDDVLRRYYQRDCKYLPVTFPI